MAATPPRLKLACETSRIWGSSGNAGGPAFSVAGRDQVRGSCRAENRHRASTVLHRGGESILFTCSGRFDSGFTGDLMPDRRIECAQRAPAGVVKNIDAVEKTATRASTTPFGAEPQAGSRRGALLSARLGTPSSALPKAGLQIRGSRRHASARLRRLPPPLWPRVSLASQYASASGTFESGIAHARKPPEDFWRGRSKK